MNDNKIHNIAIVGPSGRIGQHIITALLTKPQFTITALTRSTSTSTLPSEIHHIVPIDYTDPQSLQSALTNQDVLITTLAVTTPPEHQTALIDTAISAGVKFIFPNEWGVDVENEAVTRDTFMYDRYIEKRKYIEDKGQGKVAWIGVCSSFWYEFSLAGTEARYGFDFDKKEVTMFSGGTKQLTTTTWPQIGRAVAAVLSLDVERTDGQKAVVRDWANKAARVGSFVVSQQEMLESVLRVTGVKREDWKIKEEDVVERYERGKKLMSEGKMVGFGILLYARVFFPDVEVKGEKAWDNEVLGLPKESLDEATKRAVEMAARGETNAVH